MSDDTDLEVVVLDLEEGEGSQRDNDETMACEDENGDEEHNNDKDKNNGFKQREDKDLVTDSSSKPNVEQTSDCAWWSELEERVQQLYNEFTNIPTVYIRMVLKREDVSGNLDHAKRLLLDFENGGFSGVRDQTGTKKADVLKSTGTGTQKPQSGGTNNIETKRQQNVVGGKPTNVPSQEERRGSTSKVGGSMKSQKKGGEDESGRARENVAGGAQGQEGGDANRPATEETSRNASKQGKWRGKKSAQHNHGGQWNKQGHFRGRGGRGQNRQNQDGGGWHHGFGRGNRNNRGRGYDQWGREDGWHDSQMGPTHGDDFHEEQYAWNNPYPARPDWAQRGHTRAQCGMDWGHKARGYPRGDGRGREMHQSYSRDDLHSPEPQQPRHQDHTGSLENLSRVDAGRREAWVNPQDANPQQTTADRGKRGRKNRKGRGRGNTTRADSCDAPGSNVPEGSGANSSEGNASGGSGASVSEESAVRSEFELNKLLVKGLRKETTMDGLQNYVEVVSGLEVLETVFLEDGQALITLQDSKFDFIKTRAKAQRRQLEGVRVVLERVKVCSSVLVRGFSATTTKDAIFLYFENTRSAGGPVERVELTPDHAIVHFADPEDAENVLLREQTKPHILNNEQLSVRKFYPFMKVEEEEEPIVAQPDSAENAATKNKDRPAVNAAQTMHFAVDVDKMDLIMKSPHHTKLGQTLAQHQSEFDWKSGSPTAVITYRGQERDPEAWQSACIKEMNSCLNQFEKSDFPVEENFWQAVCDQLPSIADRLGKVSMLLKPLKDSKEVRLICLKSDIQTFQSKLKEYLEEINNREIKKTYSRKKESDIPEEKIALLKKIKFAENLMEKYSDLEVVLDDDNGHISFEGPKEQFKEAMMSYRKQMNSMSNRILNLKSKVVQILEEKMETISEEFRRKEIAAVFVINDENDERAVEVVGASSEHTQKAADLVSSLVVEEKVSVEDESLCLLQTGEWRQFCAQMEEEHQVEMRSNKWGDTWILGMAENVRETTDKVKEFVDENTVRKTQFTCGSSGMKIFLVEQRKDEIKKIAENLKEFQVKIEMSETSEYFVITGVKEGLTRAEKMLKLLTSELNVFTDTIEIKQPGLRKYLTEGSGQQMVRGVEREHECIIEVTHNFSEIASESEGADSDPKSDENDVNSDDGDEYVVVPGAATAAGPSTLTVGPSTLTVGPSTLTVGPSTLTVGNCKITWKAGDITKEQADILVSSEGACSASIIRAAGQGMAQAVTTPRTGDITTTAGFNLPCSHVIHTKCKDYDVQGRTADKYLRRIVQKSLAEGISLQMNSIAFPVIGAGKRGFPPNEASRIMLQECVQFFQTNPGSSITDVRFVVFMNDQALVTAFGQEMAAVRTGHVSAQPAPRFSRTARKKIRVQVKHGDITQENTDAIVNINGPEMNMNNAGALSKAIASASGRAVEMECRNAGQQAAGAAVMTSGGNLAVPHIIHSAPGSADKQHLRLCVENSLKKADSNDLRSVSLPAFGTGAFHLSAQDSAGLIFQALTNFSVSSQSVRQVNIVIFQTEMVQTFAQELQKWNGTAAVGTQGTIGTQGTTVTVQVRQGDITQEQTDAIVNINSTEMDMKRAGALSKAIASASGSTVEIECRNAGQQAAGAAVLTSGGNLAVGHIIHSAPGSGDKQHLQQCVENSLRVADSNGLTSVSLPAFGTGGFGLSAQDSAELTFQALANFSPTSQNVRLVNIVIFQPHLAQAFTKEQQKHVGTIAPRPVPRPRSLIPQPSRGIRLTKKSTAVTSSVKDGDATFCVLAKDEGRAKQAISALKKGFDGVCTMQKVQDKAVKMLTGEQLSQLQRRAAKLDVEVKVDLHAEADSITVRGGPTDVLSLVGEIWGAINESKDREYVELLSKNVRWYYDIGGVNMPFDEKTNAELEKASTNKKTGMTVSLRGETYKIDFLNNRGVGQNTGSQMTISRKELGASAEGITLPTDWVPMPRDPHTGNEARVHLVSLAPGSREYQMVAQKFQSTGRNVTISGIQRVQNPLLYQAYQVRKQKMDKDNGGQNNERQLFHGTDGTNISKINAQGFNRSFAGTHGKLCGAGVYFARDASYSMGYASGNAGSKQMYIARVLVGQYVNGNSSMMVPPPKNARTPEITYDSTVNNASDPSIFVVFYDTQCYPEYLIRF